jgi:hypothetical protein
LDKFPRDSGTGSDAAIGSAVNLFLTL